MNATTDPLLLRRLVPSAAAPMCPEELVLADDLIGNAATTPWIYGSFIMSLNGAIAVPDAAGEQRHVAALTDPRDRQLLCAVMAQADCLITTAGYLRDLDRGRLGNLLQTPEQPAALRAYRARHHAPAAPHVLILSRSCDFPLPTQYLAPDQTVQVLTGQAAPDERVAALRDAGFTVTRCDTADTIGADAIVSALRALNARTAYLFCGPTTSGALFTAGQLRRLYLTWCHLFQGGAGVLHPAAALPTSAVHTLRLQALYQADETDALPGLWFGVFDTPRD